MARLFPLALLLACTPDTTLNYEKEDPVEILPGSISGRVCDPSGRTWLPGAIAYTNLFDDAGVVYDTIQAETDADGRWSLPELPGEREYMVYVQYGTDILMQEPVWLGSGDTYEFEEPDCFDPLSLEIAVVTGDYDNFDTLLSSLGFVKYTVIDGLDTPTIASFLADPKALAMFDIIFFNGGHQEDGVIYSLSGADTVATTQNVDNLRAYVEEGGVVYGSDWAYDIVERLYPDRLEFVGADEVPNDAQMGDYQLVNAAVSDSAMAAHLGASHVDIEYDLPVWPPIETVASSVSVHLSGTVPYSDGTAEYTLASAPLLASYNAGQGKVVYSTFRVVPNASTELQSIFQYIMYNL